MEKGTETESHQFELKNIGFISNHQNVEKVSLKCVTFVIVFEHTLTTTTYYLIDDIVKLKIIY